ncbi:MAG: hypothetical protein KDA99_00070, partial [Planctomycetales bacterium]|nr:hypothetical protein [Planctomycetales bacterium]
MNLSHDPQKLSGPVRPGGVIHTYQKYDPQRFPSPTQPPPDLISPIFDHLLTFGSTQSLTPEQLARAVRLDPSQIAGLGPSIDALLAMLRERKRKILERFETERVQKLVGQAYYQAAAGIHAPSKLRERFERAVRKQQLYDLERIWYATGDDRSPFARELVGLMERLGEKYEIDELASKYEFHGRQSMDVPTAIAVKEELEKIDELIRQLEEARENAQIALVDLEALAEFAEPADIDNLSTLQQQVENLIRDLAQRQGLETDGRAFQLTPEAYRLFQGKLLERIFSQLQASRSGRHQGPIVGEGAVEMQQTKSYEFGDSITHLDIPQTFINAMLRQGAKLPLRLHPDDIEIHRTRNNPKCGTVVIMDMSGSMRYDGQYINVKRMGLALDGLIRSEYPGDYIH